MESAIEYRLKKVIEYLIQNRRIHNAADLAVQLGMPKSYISELQSGKKTITEKFVGRLTYAFPEISGEWLLHGPGAMLDGLDGMFSRINTVLAAEGRSNIDPLANPELFPGIRLRDAAVALGWIDCLKFVYPEYSREWLIHGTGAMKQTDKGHPRT